MIGFIISRLFDVYLTFQMLLQHSLARMYMHMLDNTNLDQLQCIDGLVIH